MELSKVDLMLASKHIKAKLMSFMGFPGDTVIKNLPTNTGDAGSIPAGSFAGEGNGNPLQHPCLENFMGRGAWWATVHGIAKSQTEHTRT